MNKAKGTANAAAIWILATTSLAVAEDFPLVGSYTENEVCTATSPTDARVTITATEINSPMGLCKILDIKRNGDSFAVHVECSGPAGNQMLGNVTFAVRADRTVDFSDQDGTYKSVLYRCP